MRTILFLIFLLAPTSVLGQLKAPQSVEEGQAIHFTLEDDETDYEAIWTVLNPFDETEVTEIRPKYSNDFIVDPPVGWKGNIRVQLILLDKERRVVDIRLSVVRVGKSGNDDENDENDDEKPEIDDKPSVYDGINELGMGQESFDLAPDVAPVELEKVAKIFEKAGLHLRGFGGLKVIKARGSERNTDKEVNVWIDNQLKDYPEFRDWYTGCLQYQAKVGITIGTPIDMWVQMFNEMAAGLRGAK